MENRLKARTVLLVLNYKKYSDAILFLKSLLDHEVDGADVIILDNGSANGSVEAIAQWAETNFPARKDDIVDLSSFALQDMRFDGRVRPKYCNGRLAIFSSDENFGFSGGNNALAAIGRQLGYEFFYFLNSDILFTDKFSVTKHEVLHEREPDAFISGPCVINKDGSFDSPYKRDSFWGDVFYYGPLNRLRRAVGLPIVQFDFNALSQSEGAPVYKISGAAMFFPAKCFFELAGFDENVWLSSEEPILGEKVLSRGGKIVYLPTTVLIHMKASAPREMSRRADILRNHFKQRNYYYRAYRGYGAIRMAILGLGQKLRLLLAER